MASQITIIKNGVHLFKASGIQEAARFLAEHLNLSINKCYDPIERGYVYNVPFIVGEDEFHFIAPDEIAAKRRKELEERDHKNARRIWLVPANPNEYDIERAFIRYETLDWKKSYNYENGDIFFIYVSGSVKRVRYKVEVVKGFVPRDEVKFNKSFWVDEQKFQQAKGWDRTRIRLVDEVNTSELSLAHLREHGLKGNIRGSIKLTGSLREYIKSFFEKDLTEGYYPDEVPETLKEGQRKNIMVNVYERNPFARKKCVDYYGVKCQICELDFEKYYGDVGKDFIHVHHIKPLHEIKQDYVVDPINDLIPVCPNCHAMLHRKEDGKYLTIEQLKKRVFWKN